MKREVQRHDDGEENRPRRRRPANARPARASGLRAGAWEWLFRFAPAWPSFGLIPGAACRRIAESSSRGVCSKTCGSTTPNSGSEIDDHTSARRRIWRGKPTAKTLSCGATRAIRAKTDVDDKERDRDRGRDLEHHEERLARRTPTRRARARAGSATYGQRDEVERSGQPLRTASGGRRRPGRSARPGPARSSPRTLTFWLVNGLMTFTTENPTVMSMTSPANWIPVKTRKTMKPKTSPTNTWAEHRRGKPPEPVERRRSAERPSKTTNVMIRPEAETD